MGVRLYTLLATTDRGVATHRSPSEVTITRYFELIDYDSDCSICFGVVDGDVFRVDKDTAVYESIEVIRQIGFSPRRTFASSSCPTS